MRNNQRKKDVSNLIQFLEEEKTTLRNVYSSDRNLNTKSALYIRRKKRKISDAFRH